MTVWRSREIPRVFVALVVFPAIVIGILSMHFLAAPAMTSGNNAHGAAHGAVTAPHHGSTEAQSDETASISVVDDCADGCVPIHSMTTMGCLLVVVVIALMLLVAPSRRHDALSPVARIAIAIAASGVLTARRPPSLTVLSISRT